MGRFGFALFVTMVTIPIAQYVTSVATNRISHDRSISVCRFQLYSVLIKEDRSAMCNMNALQVIDMPESVTKSSRKPTVAPTCVET